MPGPGGPAPAAKAGGLEIVKKVLIGNRDIGCSRWSRGSRLGDT